MLHVIIPAIALFAFYDRAYLKWTVVLAVLTIIPAIDHLPWIFGYARALLHNYFDAIPFVLIAIYGWRAKKALLKNIGIIATFYWVSHIILDFDGVKMFWPLSSQIFVWKMDVPMGSLIMVPTGLPLMLAITSMAFYSLLVFALAFLISIPNVRKTYSELWTKKKKAD